MIRCIQIGTTTIQGHVLATYPDPTGEHGAIRSMGRVVMGRLTPQERATPKRARYGDEELADIKARLGL